MGLVRPAFSYNPRAPIHSKLGPLTSVFNQDNNSRDLPTGQSYGGISQDSLFPDTSRFVLSWWKPASKAGHFERILHTASQPSTPSNSRTLSSPHWLPRNIHLGPGSHSLPSVLVSLELQYPSSRAFFHVASIHAPCVRNLCLVTWLPTLPLHPAVSGHWGGVYFLSAGNDATIWKRRYRCLLETLFLVLEFPVVGW